MTDRRRILLIGPRGSGKTTVGRRLAARLAWSFVDADELLEAREGRSVAAIFAADGEAGFRDRESVLLSELAQKPDHVIATGGGIVLRPENRRTLRVAGFCIWLTADPTTLWARIQADPATAARRPALTPLLGRAEVERLLTEREPLYREVAHLVVDGCQSPDAVVSAILSSWRS